MSFWEDSRKQNAQDKWADWTYQSPKPQPKPKEIALAFLTSLMAGFVLAVLFF